MLLCSNGFTWASTGRSPAPVECSGRPPGAALELEII